MTTEAVRWADLLPEEFTAAHAEVVVHVVSDPELVMGRFEGDHAGLYEVSQLMHIRPELVDLERLGRVDTDALGRFAQNPDAGEASAAHGRDIIEASLEAIGQMVAGASDREVDLPTVSIESCETIWKRVAGRVDEWVTLDR